MLIHPVSFGTVYFDGTTDIYAITFELVEPKAQTKIMQAAGGRVIDFDYSSRSLYIPQPFSFKVFISATTTAAVAAAYKTLTDTSTGALGKSDTFTGRKHSAPLTLYTCTARLVSVQGSLNYDGLDSPSMKTTPPITLEFHPTTQFTEV